VTTRKEWPSNIKKEHELLIDDIERLVSLMGTFMFEGVFSDHPNVGITETALRHAIPALLHRIEWVSVVANRKRRWLDESERYPNWVMWALEDIVALCIDAREGTREMKEGYYDSNWGLLKELAPIVQQDVLKMYEIINDGPPPNEEDAVSPWAELDDHIEQMWGNSKDDE
jgi:hypothetical protein